MDTRSMLYDPPREFYSNPVAGTDSEWTKYTDGAFNRARRQLAEELSPDQWVEQEFGAELRVFVRPTGVTFSVRGQACAPGGLQGTHHLVVELLREQLMPAMFIAWQGYTAWAAWLGIPGREPGQAYQGRTATIAHDHRAGWHSRDMLRYRDFLEGRANFAPFSFLVAAPEPIETSLF